MTDTHIQPQGTGDDFKKLVRFEHNIDGAPLWAPKAYANEPERIYLLPWRGKDSELHVHAIAKYGQPRKLDKLVALVLVDLWNQQGRNRDGWVDFQLIGIISALELTHGGKIYIEIKDSLNRLRFTALQFIDSFYDKSTGAMRSIRGLTILDDLWIVEPKKMKGDYSQQLAFTQFTRAKLNLELVNSLFANNTRPISALFLKSLSDRGILFEAKIASLLHNHDHVVKDVFDLWTELGLSVKGILYGSKLTIKMKPDLDKMTTNPHNPLARYTFEKSKQKPKSQNVHFWTYPATIDVAPDQPQQGTTTKKTPKRQHFTRHPDATIDSDLINERVNRIRSYLRDEGESDFNIRRIVECLPWEDINRYAFDAYGKHSDGLITNRVGYFVGIMKKQAKLYDPPIQLGLPDTETTPKDVHQNAQNAPQTSDSSEPAPSH